MNNNIRRQEIILYWCKKKAIIYDYNIQNCIYINKNKYQKIKNNKFLIKSNYNINTTLKKML
jgi:hypothetical protein